MLAGELALAGIDVVIVERRANDRRGRDGRGAGARFPSRPVRHPRPGPEGSGGADWGRAHRARPQPHRAQVVNETSPESLLDTYHAERHPVGARVLHNTMAQVPLSRPDDRHQALRDTMTDLLSMDEPRRRIGAMLSGLDIHYDLGEGHPLLGRRMPDLDLHTADGPTRVFTLLHDARPVLLNLGEPGGFDISPCRLPAGGLRTGFARSRPRRAQGPRRRPAHRP